MGKIFIIIGTLLCLLGFVLLFAAPIAGFLIGFLGFVIFVVGRLM